MGKDKKKKQKKKKSKKSSSYATTEVFKGKRENKLGKKIDHSNDNLFVGTDYREVYSWEYERSWAEILADVEHWHLMPFTLGIEQELIVADQYGNYPPGDEMVYRMKEIVKDAINLLKEILYQGRRDKESPPEGRSRKNNSFYHRF